MANNESTTEPSAPTSGWQELCPGCMTANFPGEDFCVKCGQPLSSYSGIGPLETIQTEGFLLRAVLGGTRSLVVVVGVWLFGGITALRVICTFLDLVSTADEGFEAALSILFLVTFLAAIGAILWKVTTSYTARKLRTSPQDKGNPKSTNAHGA